MHWTQAQPGAATITWPAMKAHLRLDVDDEREYVTQLVAQATAHAEALLQQALMPRMVTATFDAGESIELPRGPVLEVQNVTDSEGVEVSYAVRRRGHTVTVDLDDGLPVSYPVEVVYSAGYSGSAAVPPDIIGAIRIHAATLYSWREDASPVAASKVHHLDDWYRYRSRGTPVA